MRQRLTSAAATPLLVLCLLGFLGATPLGASPVTAQRRPDPMAAEASLEARAARKLAVLDGRLDLRTYPDGSAAWLRRLAAALERHLHSADEKPVGAQLARRLAFELRRFPATRDLKLDRGGGGGVTEPRLRDGETDSPAEVQRRERLRRLLATAGLLVAKLDRAKVDTAAGTRAAALTVPANDSCAAASVLATATVTGTTESATNDGSASCDGPTPPADVWFRFTASTAGHVAFATFGSSFDTVLSVFDGCPASGTELACDDDSAGTSQSQVVVGLTAGQEVWVRLGGFGGATGSYQLTAQPAVGIAGTVTRSDTGDPLPGVGIAVYDAYFDSLVDTTSTGTDGTYRFSNLRDGSYFVQTFDAVGFVDELYDDHACPFESSCEPLDGDGIEVGGDVVTGVDFALAPAGAIAGSLLETGTLAAVEGAVELYSLAGVLLTTADTAADGSYMIDGVPAGKYYLGSDSPGYQKEVYDDLACTSVPCDATSGDQVTVVTGATTSGVDFVVDRLGSLSGSITSDTTGDGLAGVFVQVWRLPFEAAGGFLTYEDGGYQIFGLQAGGYYVNTYSGFRDELYDDVPCEGGCDFSTGTPVSVQLNTDTPGIDFALSRNGSVSGTVRDAVTDDPLSGLDVSVYDANGGFIRSGTTDVTGVYTVTAGDTGTYFLRTTTTLYADQLYDGLSCTAGCDVTLGTPVSVNLGTETPGIDFALHRLGTLRGHVVGADEPNIGALLIAYDATGTAVAFEYPAPPDGAYTIAGLLPGTYRVRAAAVPQYQDELFDDVPCDPSCDLSTGQGLTVGLDGTISGIDFFLRLCPVDSYVDVFDTTYLSTETVEACERLTARGATTVSSGADVTFRAGRSIVLGDGFAVHGGGIFRAVIETAWAEE